MAYLAWRPWTSSWLCAVTGMRPCKAHCSIRTWGYNSFKKYFCSLCISCNFLFSVMQSSGWWGGGMRASTWGKMVKTMKLHMVKMVKLTSSVNFTAGLRASRKPRLAFQVSWTCWSGILVLPGASSLSGQGVKVTFGFSVHHVVLQIEDKQKAELFGDCISSRWRASSAFHVGVVLVLDTATLLSPPLSPSVF